MVFSSSARAPICSFPLQFGELTSHKPTATPDPHGAPGVISKILLP